MRALVLRPITVAEGVLHLRIGLEWEADIPLCQIERAELTASAEGRKVGVVGTSNFLLRLRRPVELHGPLGIRRVVRLLSLQVDDPEGLHRSLAAAGLASSPG